MVAREDSIDNHQVTLTILLHGIDIELRGFASSSNHVFSAQRYCYALMMLLDVTKDPPVILIQLFFIIIR